jgi:hypothetical protein
VTQSRSDFSAVAGFDWYQLPKANGRWVPLKKLMVVNGIKGGLITTEEFLERYPDTSKEELNQWMRLAAEHGAASLRVTRAQAYRGLGVTGST